VKLDEEVPKTSPSIMLIGYPDSTWYNNAIRYMESLNLTNITVMIPEGEVDEEERERLIEERLFQADVIVFWDEIRENHPKLEWNFDKFLRSERMFYGIPKVEYYGPNAEQRAKRNKPLEERYLNGLKEGRFFYREKPTQSINFLENLVDAALAYLDGNHENHDLKEFLRDQRELLVENELKTLSGRFDEVTKIMNEKIPSDLKAMLDETIPKNISSMSEQLSDRMDKSTIALHNTITRNNNVITNHINELDQTFSKQLQETKSDINEIGSKVDNLSKKEEAHSQEINRLAGKIDDVTNSHQASNEKLSKNISNIEMGMKETHAQMEARLNEFRADAENTKNDLSEKLLKLQKDTVFGTGELENLGQNLEEFRKILDVIKGDHLTLNDNVNHLSKVIDNERNETRAAISQATEQIQVVEQHISKNAEAIKVNRADVLEQIINQIDKLRDHNDIEIKALSGTIKDEFKEIDQKFVEAAEERDQNVKDGEAKLEKLENRINSIEHWKGKQNGGLAGLGLGGRSPYRGLVTQEAGGGSDGWRPEEINTINTSAEGTSSVVDDFPNTSFTAVRWDYSVIDGNNARTGTIMAVWDSLGNVEYNETCTNNLGDTDNLTFVVENNGGTIELIAIISDSASYSIRLKRYKI
jgi:DNA repair exonuclease SbcCD ATPase subunit